MERASLAQVIARLERMEDKLDDLTSDRVTGNDLDRLEDKLTAAIRESREATYSKDVLDPIINEVKELRRRVGEQWQNTLVKASALASILYVISQLLHLHLS